MSAGPGFKRHNAGIRMYIEDLKLGSNTQIGPKDFFEMGFRICCVRISKTKYYVKVMPNTARYMGLPSSHPNSETPLLFMTIHS